MKNNQNTLLPPCTYQGGKQRLSKQICDIIEERNGNSFVFYDLCCGSGAVSLEMLSRGHNVVMIDKGPFGVVWEKIGNHTFELSKLREEIDKLPEINNIGTYLKELTSKSVNFDLLPYQYLLIQSGSFGSKQIWYVGDKWYNNTFRSYWLPTETSNRKSPVNPMMPMPETLYNRVEEILKVATNIKGYHIDIFDSIDLILSDNRDKVVYIDPPYKNTTGYFESFDIFEVIEKLKEVPLYVSEGFAFEGFENIVLSDGRKKGNVSGTVKKEAVKEFLNIRGVVL